MERFVFRLPDLGEGVVEGEIVAWHVQPGDQVAEDQPLLDLMTDKATVTIPSVVSGKVIRTQGEVGQMVPVGGDLVELDPTCAGVRSYPLHGTLHAAGREPVSSRVSKRGDDRVHASGTTSAKPLASPAVRRRAREKGIHLQEVTGTGPGGRITDGDIDALNHQNTPSHNGWTGQPQVGTTEIHVTGLRRRIAQKMAVSYSHIPHFTYFEQLDITHLDALRKHLNARRSGEDPKLTYLPFVMLALVRTFRSHPEINAHYDDRREVITRFEAVHLGIATQTDRGLYVPVIRHVEAMDLWQAARELTRVTQATHDNTVSREELTGSTFTITSLGAIGGLGATPIINHPEVGILGIHRAGDQPVVKEGRVVVRRMVNLSASFDHRTVDGADGAAMIQTLKGYLEYPATIFL